MSQSHYDRPFSLSFAFSVAWPHCSTLIYDIVLTVRFQSVSLSLYARQPFLTYCERRHFPSFSRLPMKFHRFFEFRTIDRRIDVS